MENFRNLTESEIEVKAEIVDGSIDLTLNTTAAVCTTILNEEVGMMNWSTSYTNNNRNCILSIWDEDKHMMIAKEDCGGGSNLVTVNGKTVDSLKAQASSGFRRACARWGLGIELHTQPEIRIPITEDNVIYNDKVPGKIKEKYSIRNLEYNKKTIIAFIIVNSTGEAVYIYNKENGISEPVVKKKEAEKKEEKAYEDVVPLDSMEDVLADIESDADDEPVYDGSYIDFIDNDALPDNTDGYDDTDMMDEESVPFPLDEEMVPEEEFDYIKAIKRELKRTKISEKSMLSYYNVKSLEEMNEVDLDECLRKLQEKPSR